jgi:hypothetical protein
VFREQVPGWFTPEEYVALCLKFLAKPPQPGVPGVPVVPGRSLVSEDQGIWRWKGNEEALGYKGGLELLQSLERLLILSVTRAQSPNIDPKTLTLTLLQRPKGALTQPPPDPNPNIRAELHRQEALRYWLIYTLTLTLYLSILYPNPLSIP